MWPDDYTRRHPTMHTCDRCRRRVPAGRTRVVWTYRFCLDCAELAERAIAEALGGLVAEGDGSEASDG
jgi:hypothetical protein